MMDPGTESAKLDDFVSKSDELAEWLNQHAYDFRLRNEPRFRLTVSCFYVALEHHKSIVLLASRQYYASAFALVRILVEAYVMGQWIRSSASPTNLDSLVKEMAWEI